MPVYVLDRIEGSSLAELRCLEVPWFCGVQGLCDGATLGGRACVPLSILDHNEGFTWPVLKFKFLRDGVTLLGSSVHT